MFCPPPFFMPQRFSLLTRKCFGHCGTNSEGSPHNCYGCTLFRTWRTIILILTSLHFCAEQKERHHLSAMPICCFLYFLHDKASFSFFFFFDPCKVGGGFILPHLVIDFYSISHPDSFHRLWKETSAYKEEVILAKCEIQNLLTRYIILLAASKTSALSMMP